MRKEKIQPLKKGSACEVLFESEFCVWSLKPQNCVIWECPGLSGATPLCHFTLAKGLSIGLILSMEDE